MMRRVGGMRGMRSMRSMRAVRAAQARRMPEQRSRYRRTGPMHRAGMQQTRFPRDEREPQREQSRDRAEQGVSTHPRGKSYPDEKRSST